MHKIPAVGDRVKIREWDDMRAEYKRDYPTQDWIGTPYIAFLSDMKPLCGKEFTVGAVEEVDGVDKDDGTVGTVARIYPLEDITAFIITQFMIEPLEELSEDEYETSEVDNFLSLFEQEGD